MKKLNNKGYITIEVLIASIVAAVIAVFLIEITVKLVGRTDDAYVDTVLNTDKALIMKNIKENINKDIETYGPIIEMRCQETYCDIVFENSGTDLSKGRKILFEDNNIKYCDQKTIKKCYYTKQLNSALNNVELKVSNLGNYMDFQITAENIFAKNNYTLNILISNREKDDLIIKSEYNVILKINGSEKTSGKVISGDDYVENVAIRNARNANITCDNGTNARIDVDLIGNVKVTVYNITADTTCDITYNITY